MSARPADKKLRLTHIFVQEAGVPDNIADWILNHVDGPQCESPADFAQLWSSSTVEGGPKVDVLDLITPLVDATTFAGRRLAGRLRTAWEYCKQDIAGEAKLLAEPPKAEEEHDLQPWPDSRRRTCADEVLRLYKLILKPDEVPASAIMNRLDRTWRDRKADLIQLLRMKTQADLDLLIQRPAKERSLGIECGDAELVMRQGPGELPPCDLDNVDQILQAMQVMANGWLLVGTKEEESIDPRKGKVHSFDINDASAWVRFARKMARSARRSGDSEASIVRYLRVREFQTRTAATKYWKDDAFPWGEAITKALAIDMAVLWTVTGHTNAFGIQVSIPGITDVHPELDHGKRPRSSSARSDSPPALRPRKATTDDGGPRKVPRGSVPLEWRNLPSKDLRQHMFCPDFQKGTCPAASASQCPRDLLHRCDRWLPGNMGFCGATQHGRKDCNRKDDKNQTGKGKGKAKGGMLAPRYR